MVSASAYVTGNPLATPADFDRWANSVQAMRRYPELQNIGLVKLVPAGQLGNFERYLDAHPVRPLGPHSVAPEEGFQVLPAGQAPLLLLRGGRAWPGTPPPTSRRAPTTAPWRRR